MQGPPIRGRTTRARQWLQLGAIVSVVLFTGVLAIASLVWQAQHNDDRIAQARAGCARGNVQREIVNRQGASLRTLAAGSAALLEDLTPPPAALTTADARARAAILRRQAEDYRKIAAGVRQVPLVDCAKAYR